MNGGGNRDSMQQNMYASSLPHASMYAAVVPGMQQRVHPIVSSLQLGNGGYPKYYELPYPSFLVQNNTLYNPARMPTGIVREAFCSNFFTSLSNVSFYMPYKVAFPFLLRLKIQLSRYCDIIDKTCKAQASPKILSLIKS